MKSCPEILGLKGALVWRTSLVVLIWMICAMVFATGVIAQEPVPALPQVYIDTTWNPPNGTVWNVNSGSGFQLALNLANPGDTVVLTAGTQIIGNFTLPAKSNPNGLWIYIESSALSSLPPPGTRVNPANDEPNMPQVITPNVFPAISVAAGATNYRLVGLEIVTKSNQGCAPHNTPPVNCYSYQIVDTPPTNGVPLPDYITIDRSYIHGSPTQDSKHGVVANGTHFAVIDSYISDIHGSLSDSQAILAYSTPGPLKIVNNFLSATTEDLMLGGAGGPNNPYVPSDVEIRRNHLFKPLSWDAPGITLPPYPKWVVKDNLELKSGQRVLISGNILENNWLSGQIGYSVQLTVRTSQSGNIAVVDDITFENNVLTNVDAGINSIETDDLCKPPGYPQCTNPGQSKRWKIYNNLMLLRPVNDGSHHNGFSVGINQTDFIFQHNTVLMSDQSTCWASMWFNQLPSWHWPPPQSFTHNGWVLDNALCRQPSGDSGGQGGLNWYMQDPTPMAPRFFGNVMFLPSGDRMQSYPPENDPTTVPFTYVNPSNGDYQLLTPAWYNTTDGKISGIDWGQIQNSEDDGVLQITTQSLGSGVIGVNYSATVLALGGTPPYTWAVTSGSLPNGLSLDPNSGIISGTPTTAGTSNFTVTVTDSSNPPVNASVNLSITIAPMSIANKALPGAVINVPYSYTLSATGGFPPLSWAVTNGSLPPGLNLDPNSGTISGTPNTLGSFPFTITVTDSAYPPNQATANFSITVGSGIHL